MKVIEIQTNLESQEWFNGRAPALEAWVGDSIPGTMDAGMISLVLFLGISSSTNK